MMSEKYCIEQAESCERAAQAASLANQRDTFLRSRAVWLEMAERQQSLRTARAERERSRTEEPSHVG